MRGLVLVLAVFKGGHKEKAEFLLNLVVIVFGFYN